jgi:HK97 family phage prohead protease
MVADFSGYVTRAGLKCSDGRTITPEAFKHMDGVTVPLVYQHGHKDIENVLGHVKLEARDDGVYGYGFFNDSPNGKAAKIAVQHKDITRMSIYANQLVEKLIAGSKAVLHGMIREVSLVLAGANPGALIDWVQVAHGDGEFTVLTDEAVIHTGLDFDKIEDVVAEETKELVHQTAQDVYDSLDEEQKNLVNFMIAAAIETGKNNASTAQSATTDPDKSDDKPAEDKNDEGDLTHKEGTTTVTKNVFEKNGEKASGEKHTLSHSDIKGIVSDAVKIGSLKAAVENYALAHGIENIDVLFPDAKTLSDRPEFNKRRTEWVAGVINGTRHTPFSRVKSIVADLTFEEARARGYIKGNFKKEEFFGVSKRVTTPTTIYKKQKLDRDDIIDITDFDVVAWLKMEIRMMLEEEIARAILIGDGRDVSDEDKIKDPAGATEGAGIRAIVNDHELYVTTVNVNLDDSNSSYLEAIESILLSRRFYKGTGMPTFYTTEETLTRMLLLKDEANSNRRLFRDEQELASYLRVDKIVAVEVMEDEPDIVGILVNLADYNVGTDRGGEITLFDDFDIDYNQYKYLMETRLSGALVKIKSALVVRKTTGTNVLVDPVTEPTFVASTGVVTIPSQTGVVYKNDVTDATLTAGAQTALAAGATLKVRAEAASGYYFATDAEDQWSFTRPAA